jgi:hypothetical protein|tara:strand:+ start:513 stop:731 length:219 start_codon:yes stop_codon:yes gene_type:complete
MSFIKTFLKTDTYPLRRWIVKKDKEGLIREVKCIFNPDEYSESLNARPMYGDRRLKEILIKDKEKRNEKNLQ